MSISRKNFLKVTMAGGLASLFGGAFFPRSILDGGARLVPIQRQSLLMGSVVSFDVIAESEKAGYEAIRKGVAAFREVQQTFSMYSSTSEMAKLGARAGLNDIPISDMSCQVLITAKDFYRETGGLFDITVEPAMKRWGFRKNKNDEILKPSYKELKTLEELTGSDKLILQDGKAKLLKEGMAVDTGGIAGGYALDQAVRRMKQCDISAAFINFSGDISCFGRPISGEQWEVQILNPQTMKPLRHPVYIENESLSTSAAYQNRRHSGEDESWGHLMNPALARPVEPMDSVTVIHPSAMYADAWSTAAYVGAELPDTVKSIIL